MPRRAPSLSSFAAAAAAACACAGAAPEARAQAIPTNDYALDLFQGPLLAPIRVTGIAGSYAGYAEGIEGMVASAAAPAVREPFSTNWLEVDVSGSLSIPLVLGERDDFDNDDRVDADYGDFVYGTIGAMIRAGPFGAGTNAELQRYTLSSPGGASTAVTVGKYHLLGAWAFAEGQVMVGAGARIVTLGLETKDVAFTIAGAAPEAGILVRPNWRSFRFGATYRFAVGAGELIGDAQPRNDRGVREVSGLVVPDRVVLPWELELGLAVQVGPRPLNPVWIDPREQEAAMREATEKRRTERALARDAELAAIDDPAERAARGRQLAAEEAQRKADERARFAEASARLTRERVARHRNWPRERLLVTSSLRVTGAVPRGVSIARFLGQKDPAIAEGESYVGTSGQTVNFSPSFGIETEPVPGLVATRFGSYYEPKRVDGGTGRQHVTFGADLRLFSTTFWGLFPETMLKAQGSVDVAPRYQSFSAGIGVWH